MIVKNVKFEIVPGLLNAIIKSSDDTSNFTNITELEFDGYGEFEITSPSTGKIKIALPPSQLVLLDKSVTDVSHTGDTNETKAYSYRLPANTVQAGQILRFVWRARKVGTVGNLNVQVRFGTANDLTGTVIANYALPTTNLWGQGERTILIKDSTHFEIFAISSSPIFDKILSTLAASSVTVDLTVDNYFVISLSNGSGFDTTFFSGWYLELLN